jgi:hypothetical protein
MHLNSDGTAVYEKPGANGAVETATATWQYVDGTHWKFKVVIPPEPDTPGLEEGAIDVSDFEIISFSPQRMEVTLFDYDSKFIYERV